MTPQKARTLIGKTATKSGYSEDTCKKVIEFFYKELRSKLSDLHYKKIIVDHLGSFYCKEKTLESFRRRYESVIAHMEAKEESPKKERILRWAKEELKKVERIQEQYRIDREKREFFFLHKNTLNEAENTGNLEE